jgi:bacteriocin biosynthesis cyclodehydratase domain-containing protein
MAVHTGGNRRGDARPDPAAAGSGDSRVAQFDGKDVPRFAPNFSIYVLPPDAVCLYSEDRKFFLHGELFCGLADAVGKGKTFAQIVRELSKTFPTDAIQQAIARLIDRRYIVSGRRASATAASAYWASLGLPLDVAADNLKKCRVRIQSIGSKGKAELGAALKKLGVRVVPGAADLTVTLVDDYLDEELAELNRQHLSKRTPWLLVQPSGAFPLVGPVFSPGNGPCWACLTDRMRRNRQIKALLDRRQARRVAVSPLARDTVGGSGIALAAAEIAKAIATDFRTPLNDHTISLDLSGPSIVKHYVAARPQCPSCGSKTLRDPRRKPVPVELKAGAKLIMTSGGYRSVSSRETVAKNRKHVSPLTGVVSRLERIEVDLPLNTNYYAAHNFSAPAETIDELRDGLSGGSFGKGSTAEQGEASALMEAIERYSGMFQGDEIRVTRRFTDFAPGEAILPNDMLLFSDAQYQRWHLPPGPSDVTPIPPPFDPSAKVEWTPVWSLRDKRFKYLPTGLMYFFHHGNASTGHMHADSNGCAAGNTVEEAIVQGFLELVERDSYAIWWYNRSQRAELELGQFDDAYVRDLKTQFAETGRRLWVLDITNDLGIPSFVAMAHAMKDGHEVIEYGSGSHFDTRIALLRALTELNQFLSIGLTGGRDMGASSNDELGPFRLQDHPYLIPNGSPVTRPDFGGQKFGSLDTRDQALTCVEVANRAGLDFLVLDQTRPDIEVPVARVIVPGLRHFYRRFGPGRLYDVPVQLGLRDKPILESELNPFHPHT